MFIFCLFYILNHSDASNIQNQSSTIPQYNPNVLTGWQVDLRGKDISMLNLEKREDDLLHSDFDTKTIWTKNLPTNYNPFKILESSENPGLNIIGLHNIGVTGKNVNVAIIDSWMPDNHIEYSKQLKMYKSYAAASSLQFHGSAVTSIVVGKNTGVAPDANLYYIGTNNYENGKADFTSYAKAIEEIVDINKKLDNKIRVLSISTAWAPDSTGYNELIRAIKDAIAQNIFVVSPNMFEYYSNKFYFYGIEIGCLKDRDKADNYNIVPWDKWINMLKNSTNFAEYYKNNFNEVQPSLQLLIPIGCKTVASQLGKDDYTFFSTDGWSWGIPYIAGLYALVCQVKPNITPEEFWSVSLNTGVERIINKDNKNYIGKIVNPQKLISELMKQKVLK